ncbi:MAG: hypothetical protein M0015_00050 [Betaproteobacteria bacterium]|nr:hypothetical protein [Betaproteobacteria bacterium]
MALLGNRPRRRLEAALYVLVAALLALVLLDRLQRYAELAERAAMETTLANLQTALQVKFMLAAARSGPKAVAEAWRGGNPVTLVGSEPPNYLGERNDPDLHSVPGGSWLFDSGRKELVYVPRSARFLHLWPIGNQVPVLRFTLRVEGAPPSSGWVVHLAPVGPYTWGSR